MMPRNRKRSLEKIRAYTCIHVFKQEILLSYLLAPQSQDMAATLSTLKPMLPIEQAINIYPYSAIPIAAGHSKYTGTICIMESIDTDLSTLYIVVPMVTCGLLHLFNVTRELRIKKRIWILEKAGIDAVCERRRLLTRCEKENA